jgi:hypothetical protein
MLINLITPFNSFLKACVYRRRRRIRRRRKSRKEEEEKEEEDFILNKHHNTKLKKGLQLIITFWYKNIISICISQQ